MCDPATPVLQPASPDTPAIEDVDPLDSSSNSTCSCCVSVPDSGYPTEPAIEDMGVSVGLEERFLRSLQSQSTTPFCVQAVAIAPPDPRTTGNWPLIQLLSHRTFSALQDQRRLRSLSMFLYEDFGPGDVLLITARPVTQNALKWLEATITREGAHLATVKALFDGPSVEDKRVGPGNANDLASDFDKLTTTPSDM